MGWLKQLVLELGRFFCSNVADGRGLDLLWERGCSGIFRSMYLAECELQIAAQLGGPGWQSEVRAVWEAAHTRMEATTLAKTGTGI